MSTADRSAGSHAYGSGAPTFGERVRVVFALAVSRDELVDHDPAVELLLQQVALVQEHWGAS